MTCQLTLGAAGGRSSELLRRAMGTATGLQRRSVEDNLQNHETANYRWGGCSVDAHLVSSDRDGRTYRCPVCGAQITEVGR